MQNRNRWKSSRRKTRITDEDRIAELVRLSEQRSERTDSIITDEQESKDEETEEKEVDFKTEEFKGYSFSWKEDDN